MSKKTCACGEDLNLGVKSSAIFGVATQIGFMEMQSNTGADNGLDLSVVWNTQFWKDELAKNPFSSRLLLSPIIEDYTPSISDPNTITRASGKVVQTGGGNVKSYEWFVDYGDGTLFNALDALKCKEIGIFVFDECGRVTGSECTEDLLSPKQLGSGTLNVQQMDASDTDTQRIKVTYSLDLTESQSWDIVETSDQDNTITGLTSVCDAGIVGTPSIESLVQTVANLAAFSSFAKKDIPAEGLDTAPYTNWVITDSAGATSTPTLVTETVGTPGEYTLDYAAIPAGLTKFYYLDNNFEVTFYATVA